MAMEIYSGADPVIDQTVGGKPLISVYDGATLMWGKSIYTSPDPLVYGDFQPWGNKLRQQRDSIYYDEREVPAGLYYGATGAEVDNVLGIANQDSPIILPTASERYTVYIETGENTTGFTSVINIGSQPWTTLPTPTLPLNDLNLNAFIYFPTSTNMYITTLLEDGGVYADGTGVIIQRIWVVAGDQRPYV